VERCLACEAEGVATRRPLCEAGREELLLLRYTFDLYGSVIASEVLRTQELVPAGLMI
jgi:hypothetical protein